jgi:hypothetical protein
MSQHINPTPKQTDLTALNSNMSNVLVPTLPEYVQRVGNGGYIKCGKIVIVSITIKTLQELATMNSILKDLPRTVAENAVLNVRNINNYAALTTARISVSSAYPDSKLTADNTYTITGVYIASE